MYDETHLAMVTVGVQAGTSFTQFSFDGPVVSHTFAKNVPLASGGIVTVQGLHFAIADLTSTAALSLSEVCYSTS